MVVRMRGDFQAEILLTSNIFYFFAIVYELPDERGQRGHQRIISLFGQLQVNVYFKMFRVD